MRIGFVAAGFLLAGGLWFGGVPVRAETTATGAGAAIWNPAEIAAARDRCRALLEPREVIAIPATPVRHGACGAPAPVLLLSVGTAPQVSLSPPPLVTCEIAAALADWIETGVQPAARETLDGAVIRMEVMSAYSCRNAYGRLQARLSEHGRANALDISMFVTELGEVAQLGADWGDTARDIAARLAAVGKPEEAAKAAEAVRDAAVPGTTLSLRPPARLGGPRREPALEPRQRFLRRIHAAACRHFGTVLGPEANEAHRHHFHMDMAERKVRRICE